MCGVKQKQQHQYIIRLFTGLQKATLNQLLCNRSQITADLLIIQFINLEPFQFPLKEPHIQLLSPDFMKTKTNRISFLTLFIMIIFKLF